MQLLSGKSVLFFCPVFFGYEKEIKKTLQNLGATVTWFDDRPSNNFYSKALIRLNKKFLKNKINKYYNEVIRECADQKFDYLFFVNPESISIDILSALKASFPGAKAILYMWDSFKNRRHNLELLPLFNSKFTFDREDSIAYDLQLRPLFYIDTYRNMANRSTLYQLLFVGTAHSDRYSFVKKICNENGLIKVRTYFYLSSKLLFFVKKLTERSFRDVKKDDVSFVSLTHSDISQMMSESEVILDINHPRQIGLTMRTFEAMGAQRKLVTTNNDIVNYEFYNEANIFLINREDGRMSKGFLTEPFCPLSDEIMFKYSIEGWVREIFEI